MPKVRLAQLHPTILWSAVCLMLVGVVIVTSASLHVAASEAGDAFYFSVHQAVYLLLGLVVGGLVYFLVPIQLLLKTRLLALLAGFIALVLVLLPGIGVAVNGSSRWINLGVITVQASEVAKLCFVIYLAGYIDTNRTQLKQHWQAFLGPMLVLAGLAVMLLLEPDFGAVVVLGICALGMLLMAGVPLLYFGVLMVLALLLGGVIAVAEPYRVARLLSFINPWQHQFDSGYQLTQSLIAFGRGHWFGVGLGHGVQKLFYLPEAHTDFVFAVWAEELGLAGVSFIVGIFTLLGYSMFKLAWRSQQDGNLHGAMLVFGFGMIICTQAFVNMGVTMGILPTKGLTLPFVSYGGSSLMIFTVMLAITLRVAAEQSYFREQGRLG